MAATAILGPLPAYPSDGSRRRTRRTVTTSHPPLPGPLHRSVCQIRRGRRNGRPDNDLLPLVPDHRAIVSFGRPIEKHRVIAPKRARLTSRRRWPTLCQIEVRPPSSRGLGYQVLILKTGVRVPLGVLRRSRCRPPTPAPAHSFGNRLRSHGISDARRDPRTTPYLRPARRQVRWETRRQRLPGRPIVTIRERQKIKPVHVAVLVQIRPGVGACRQRCPI
jgi:hypothetical protein